MGPNFSNHGSVDNFMRRVRQEERRHFIVGVVVLILVAGVVLLARLSMGDQGQGEAIRAAENNGFSDVTVYDHDYVFASLNGCGQSETTLYKIHATNPAGKRVNMLVCSAPFKGYTLRSP